MSPRLITLLTDFGSRDGYVGAMKGVIARFAPEARVVDICHEIHPQDIRRAGIVWAEAVRFFPEASVHVAVVDPGVGTRRRILGFEARGSVFLAADNGLIGYVLGRREIRRSVEVKCRELFLTPVSSTFHGRDIFAPIAARLSMGLDLDALGPHARSFRFETLPRPRISRRRLRGKERVLARGEVVHVDAFGNAITNLRRLEGSKLEALETGGGRIRGLSRAYADVEPGEVLALVASSGFLEIAVNGGSAVESLRLRRGDPVVAWFSRS